MLAEKLPFYQREMRIIEERLHQICVDNYITDDSLETPNLSYREFLLSTVPFIEDIAKELHQELAPQFPNLAVFKEREPFDYVSLKFLSRALNLTKKQIQIVSDLVVLSSENRTLYPIFCAYSKEQLKRPNWLLAYQNAKHNFSSILPSTAQSVANGANGTTSAIHTKRIITAKTVLEAAGTYFLLFSAAKSLALDKPVPYGNFDPKFGSSIFTTTFTRPIFTFFTGNLDNSTLEVDTKWKQSLFIVKYPDDYIITLRNKFVTRFNQAMQELRDNHDYSAFYDNLPEDQKSNTLGYIISKYAEISGDSKWAHHINSLISQTDNEHASNWDSQDITLMRLNKAEPVVVLNTYRNKAQIYDYAKINNS